MSQTRHSECAGMVTTIRPWCSPDQLHHHPGYPHTTHMRPALPVFPHQSTQARQGRDGSTSLPLLSRRHRPTLAISRRVLSGSVNRSFPIAHWDRFFFMYTIAIEPGNVITVLISLPNQVALIITHLPLSTRHPEMDQGLMCLTAYTQWHHCRL